MPPRDKYTNISLREAGVAHAKQRSEDVVERLRKAMATIDEEIKGNNGVYPFNSGKLSQVEVCRRANVYHMTLHSPVHKTSTKLEVAKWLKNKRAEVVPVNRMPASDTASYWKNEHAKVATQIHIYELELNERDLKITELKVELEVLRGELSASGKKKITLLRPQN